MRWLAGLLLCLCAPVAGAEEMAGSLRPLPNPVYLLPEPATLPAAAAAIGDGSGAKPADGPAGSVLASSLRPMPRPPGWDPTGTASANPQPAPEGKAKRDRAGAKGSVCGVASIKGEPIAPITSRVKGCGLKDGVRVTSVSGVRLSQAATIDCATAKALNTWVREVAQPVYGGAIVELKIAAHYICRPRNNKSGAKISEHGRGKAVDIGGFVLDSGRVLTVAGNYNRTMRKAHKGACGIFGTTLGPGSDGYHEDHLHFDTASHRSGPYCR